MIKHESDFRYEESFIERAESSCKRYRAVFLFAQFQSRAAGAESSLATLLLLYAQPMAKSTPIRGIAIASESLHFFDLSSSKLSQADSLHPQIF